MQNKTSCIGTIGYLLSVCHELQQAPQFQTLQGSIPGHIEALQIRDFVSRFSLCP